MANTRLDNIINNSHRFDLRISGDVKAAREKAKKNLEWARSRVMVNGSTGEIVTDKEGKVLTLGYMSKSWFCEKGGRNNAFSIVKRLSHLKDFPVNEKKYLPKFISLTFAKIDESWQAERALQKFLNALRTWAKRQGVEILAYFWTGEVQKRGALHYHILILGAPFITREQLGAWWSFGFSDIRAVYDYEGAFKYLAKYLWKWGHLANDPDNLPDWWFYFSIFSKRRYGFSKWFSLPPTERIPRWLKESLESYQALGEIEKARRVVGGGWLVSARSPCFDGAQVEFRFESHFKVVEYRA